MSRIRGATLHGLLAKTCLQQRTIGFVLAALLSCAGNAWAEGPRDKDEIPPKRDISLVTDDDVLLRATFWPGTKEKESVPVILLHMYGGNRHDFTALAELLQKRGCAVIAPDLRGHGDSIQVRDSSHTLRASEMRPDAFLGMVDDVEAVKKFLMGRNNAGELNIDKLCVIGAEMGAVVAANWAIEDWNWPPLAVGKQGQDLKALVLLSPTEKFKALRMVEPLADHSVRARISVYIAVGKDDPAALREATKIFNTFKRHHPPPARAEDQDLFFDARIPTARLQGTKLLSKEFSDYKLGDNIAEFIETRAGKQPYVWQDRKLP